MGHWLLINLFYASRFHEWIFPLLNQEEQKNRGINADSEVDPQRGSRTDDCVWDDIPYMDDLAPIGKSPPVPMPVAAAML